MTEREVLDLLHQRYSRQRAGNGERYVRMEHVRSDAGFDARRTADFMALDLWPSQGLLLHGHEVKCSRSDWLRELKDLDKSAEFMRHCDYWWLAVSDRAIVKPGELPYGWGLLAPGADGQLRSYHQAPRLRPKVPAGERQVERGLVAAMLRAAVKTAANR